MSYSHHFLPGRISLPVAASAIGLLLITLALFWFTRPNTPDPEPQVPTKSGASRPATPLPSPTPDPPTPPLPFPPGPAEVPVADADITSRLHIESIQTSEGAAETHRALTADLMTRLEQLADSHDVAKIKVAGQELADRFYLLDRVVKLRKLQKPGSASVTTADQAQLQLLIDAWQTNMEVANTVDQLFRERNLLQDEHVPYMLRRWMQESP